ncbi:E3 ubiquitin-protein ligase TRIM17-like [Chanos chanos]|uniref:E3 ubiquitin-protein ligase TRIM17-like n=1 Tax=Chanos chanos TaxID=29144 RepID=A0A6J2W764_CHACN|nr:E3 ubiquitin-protein ligase TRIM17-like [Chanos chanos]
MAAKRIFADEDFTCPVCCDIFTDPVLLQCSHSVCKACVEQYWITKPFRQCPICRKRSKRNPPINLALRNLCEAFLEDRNQRASEVLCALHDEKLKLFCLDDKEPVCLVCRDSSKHKDHRFRPVDEAVRDVKEEIRRTLIPLNEKKRVLEKAKQTFIQKEQYVQSQGKTTEKLIKEEFLKLHQFLFKEQESRMTAVREERRIKCEIIQKKVETMDREISSVIQIIREVEKRLGVNNISVLQNFKDTLKQ